MPTANGPQNQPRFDVNDESDFASDLTAVSDYAAKYATVRSGTTTERTSTTGLDLRPGMLWADTTDGQVYQYKSGGWAALIGDTGWLDPTFVNGGNAGSGNPAAQYRRRNGIVYMTGFWVPTANSEIQFRFPPGFRPLNTLTFWCDRNVAGGPGGRMEVQAGTGSVIYRTTTIGTGAVNYAPIMFPADA